MFVEDIQIGDWIKFEWMSGECIVGKVSEFTTMGIMLEDEDGSFGYGYCKKITEEEAMLWKLKN